MRPAAFSQRARRDLGEARRWIAKDSPSAVRRLQAAVHRLAVLLGDYPLSGTQRPDLASPPYRFSPVQGFPYLVVYDPTSRPPLVVRFAHGARDLPEVLRDLRADTSNLYGGL